MGRGVRTRIDGVVHYSSEFTNIGRLIATIETGTENGSWSHPALATGQVDWMITPLGEGFYVPLVTFSGTTITWTFVAPSIGGSQWTRFNNAIAIWVV